MSDENIEGGKIIIENADITVSIEPMLYVQHGRYLSRINYNCDIPGAGTVEGVLRPDFSYKSADNNTTLEMIYNDIYLRSVGRELLSASRKEMLSVLSKALGKSQEALLADLVKNEHSLCYPEACKGIGIGTLGVSLQGTVRHDGKIKWMYNTTVDKPEISFESFVTLAITLDGHVTPPTPLEMADLVLSFGEQITRATFTQEEILEMSGLSLKDRMKEFGLFKD